VGFVWHVALRYCRSTRADAHIRVLSTLTGGGLALGTAALVLALAALSGFQNHLLAAARTYSPALQIELAGGSGDNWRREERDALSRSMNVKFTTPRSLMDLVGDQTYQRLQA